MPEVRPPTGGQFALEILGAIAGALKKFDGLGMEAEVVTNNLGPRNIQKKHVTKVKRTPGRSMIGIGMGREMSTLIQQAFQAQQKPFDGALHLANASGKIQSSRTFTSALITSVTVPTGRARTRRTSTSNGRPSKYAGSRATTRRSAARRRRRRRSRQVHAWRAGSQ